MSKMNLIKGVNLFLTEHNTSEPLDPRYSPLLEFIKQADIIVDEAGQRMSDEDRELNEKYLRYFLNRRLDKGPLTNMEMALLSDWVLENKPTKPYWEQLRDVWADGLSYFAPGLVWAFIESAPKKRVCSPEGEEVIGLFYERSPVEESLSELEKPLVAARRALKTRNTSAFLEKFQTYLKIYSKVQIERNEAMAELLNALYKKNKWAKILLIMGDQHNAIQERLEVMNVPAKSYRHIDTSRSPTDIPIVKKIADQNYLKSPEFEKEAYLFQIFTEFLGVMVKESHFSFKQYNEKGYELYLVLKKELTERELEEMIYYEFEDIVEWLHEKKDIEISDYIRKVRTPRKPLT